MSLADKGGVETSSTGGSNSTGFFLGTPLLGGGAGAGGANLAAVLAVQALVGRLRGRELFASSSEYTVEASCAMTFSLMGTAKTTSPLP